MVVHHLEHIIHHLKDIAINFFTAEKDDLAYSVAANLCVLPVLDSNFPELGVVAIVVALEFQEQLIDPQFSLRFV